MSEKCRLLLCRNGSHFPVILNYLRGSTFSYDGKDFNYLLALRWGGRSKGKGIA